MDGGLIVVLAVLAAVCLRVFWRPLAELALVLVLAAVFVGIITLVTTGHAMLGG